MKDYRTFECRITVVWQQSEKSKCFENWKMVFWSKQMIELLRLGDIAVFKISNITNQSDIIRAEILWILKLTIICHQSSVITGENVERYDKDYWDTFPSLYKNVSEYLREYLQSTHLFHFVVIKIVHFDLSDAVADNFTTSHACQQVFVRSQVWHCPRDQHSLTDNVSGESGDLGPASPWSSLLQQWSAPPHTHLTPVLIIITRITSQQHPPASTFIPSRADSSIIMKKHVTCQTLRKLDILNKNILSELRKENILIFLWP